jgi:putative membrane protein
MERPQNIKPSVQNKRTAIAIRLIIVFHLIGLTGLSVAALRPLFLQLVPYHLLLMMLVLFFSHDKFGTKLILFFVTAFAIGFIAEWIGVHKGLLFGNYTYGNTLGPKLDGVPFIIGVNWFILIYATGVASQQSPIKATWLRIVTGALVLVLLDMLIEPTAIRLDYWHWAGNSIPVKNYVCWFAISAAMLFVFEKFRFKKQGMTGVVLLVVQFIFFLALLSG